MKKLFALSMLFLTTPIYAKNAVPQNNPTIAKRIAGLYEHQGVEGTSEAHLFFENGDYCYMAGAVGSVINFAGKWQSIPQKNGNNQIKLSYESYFNTLFPAWISTNEIVEKPQIIIPERSFEMGGVFGFSESTIPKNLKPLFKNRDSQSDKYRTINIPDNARYIFIGGEKNDNGELLLTRYNLSQVRNKLNPIYLGMDVNYLALKSLKDSPNIMVFANNKLIVKNTENRQNFTYERKSFQPKSDIPNKNEEQFYAQTCVKAIRNQNKELATMSLIFLPDYLSKPSQILKPTIVAWKGNVDNEAWFDKPDPTAKSIPYP